MTIPISFHDLGWQDDYTDYFTEHVLGYYGISLGVNYSLFKKEKNKLIVFTNLQFVNFIPYKWHYLVDAVLANQQIEPLIDVPMKTSYDKFSSLAPSLGFSYQRQINKKTILTFNVSATYSRHIMMKTDGKFQIFGTTKTAKGSYLKRYKYIAAGIGMLFLLE